MSFKGRMAKQIIISQQTGGVAMHPKVELGPSIFLAWAGS